MWGNRYLECHIRGWRAVSAAGLQGKGSPKRIVFLHRHRYHSACLCESSSPSSSVSQVSLRIRASIGSGSVGAWLDWYSALQGKGTFSSELHTKTSPRAAEQGSHCIDRLGNGARLHHALAQDMGVELLACRARAACRPGAHRMPPAPASSLSAQARPCEPSLARS